MSVPVLTCFNNKGGVGKTSLVYHLAWMFTELGHTVVAVDLDAQANLTAAFLTEDEIELLWEVETVVEERPSTIYQAIEPLAQMGDINSPRVRMIAQGIHLIPGDIALASFEGTLSEAWPKSLDDAHLNRWFRILSAFWHVAQMAAKEVTASLILVDVGPNLGALSRSALIASDYVAIPLGADIFSLRGLKNLGPTLESWRKAWKKRLKNWESPEFELPQGQMKPIGYIVQQHGVRLTRPIKAYDAWINRMPMTYHQTVLDAETNAKTPTEDSECLATIKHYRSLIPIGQAVRKPIFHLTPADGAIGSHAQAVSEARKDFEQLAKKLLRKMNLDCP